MKSNAINFSIMKKISILVAGILSVLTITCIAQQGPRQQLPVPERVQRTIDRLKPELNLTEKQVKDLNPVYTEFYTEVDKLRSGGNPTPEDRQKLIAARDEKLKKILDEEQMKKLKEIEEQMRQRRPGGPN